MPSPKTPGWNDCKKTIANWPHKGLVALVHELFQLNDDNRQFLIARLVPQRQGAVFDEAKKKVIRCYRSYESMTTRFSSREVYHVLDQFAKAVDDGSMVAELTIAALAKGISVFAEFGGDDSSMADHLYVLLRRICELLPHVATESQDSLVRLLVDIGEQWSGKIGYGLADEIDDVAAEWRKRLGPSEM